MSKNMKMPGGRIEQMIRTNRESALDDLFYESKHKRFQKDLSSMKREYYGRSRLLVSAGRRYDLKGKPDFEAAMQAINSVYSKLMLYEIFGDSHEDVNGGFE